MRNSRKLYNGLLCGYNLLTVISDASSDSETYSRHGITDWEKSIY